MEKASAEGDWDWEILPRDGLLEFPKQPVFNPNGIFETNYFVCPTPTAYHSCPESLDRASDSGDVKLLQPGSPGGKDLDGDLVKDILEVPVMEISRIPPVILEKLNPRFTGEQDSFSQVFFKKMKETEFDDMKIGSPRSATIKPHLEMGAIQFEDKEEVRSDGDFEYDTSKIDDQEQGDDGEMLGRKQEYSTGGNGFTIWKWRITGIGALCSMGVAAATICIFIIGSCHKHKQQNQSPKLRFQIYSDDKV